MNFTIVGENISVNVPTKAALLARVAKRLAQKQGFALATINLDHLVKLRTSQTFRAAYVAQDFVVADGHPIVWMSRLAGRPVELMPGSDIIVPLAKLAARQGVSVALVGSRSETLEAAKSYLEREIRDLKVVLTLAPPMGFDASSEDANKLLAKVAASGAGLCFVAMGAPKQEVLAAAGRRVAPNVGFASIGAGLDFFAGAQSRAPNWVRAYALEWLWRALSDPRRLGLRYLKCLGVLPGQLLRAALQRLRDVAHHRQVPH
ncbi:glycosyl transferase [Salipiger aestuarii]|uniref:Exopolysaccharide biosynthesis WecB/TagA/CpsF family protein n=1 Tax=Salipiger aestuarii TaxID=568098 RepID=A0A327YG36_9RHOB|nr:WecB/TagA/CpsF family glycosyltransferase [Salipiger aestuarii]EIE51503.1 WecB/TagA/CpsF family glycosyl transferase [Citreicella sp. 357]KAA8608476.1 glycosyl transferase [Salipiger aestuarii]KAA8612246.1 glycosyl transferase [Salipiger aestuarii]KAB2541374.1 glycosyl transferase [Salipiger aestuarii]RAK20028.1 exopolysaccharide biosynthesis WecB/TagA/CpsF family protein [Salipiger aestuarii]